MSEKLVLVANFYMPAEAQLACGLLETEGIRAVLTGCQTVNVFGIQGLGGQIQLQVAEGDAARAAEILGPQFERRGDDRDADAENYAALWLCPLCDDPVNDDLEFCPACATPRPIARGSLAVTAKPGRNLASQGVQEEPVFLPEKITSDPPLEGTPPALEGDLVVPDMETFVGDDMVRRAFISSLFGVLVPYSLWLLVRLTFYSGKISPPMMRKFYWTMVIDSFWLLGVLLFPPIVFWISYPLR